ncbi:hypothetical protein B0H19DRAFT_1070260 [Mycena capillaripes]|nr:hypothetical protein B0H19DRAFT_1070260 [Mycena capillaripes]
MATFPQDFLSWHQIFNDSEKYGLSNGSLYEVLQNTTPGKGTAQVSAVGFNVTCGYLLASVAQVYKEVDVWDISLDGFGDITFHGMFPSLLSVLQVGDFDAPANSIVIYTTNPVVDSDGHQKYRLIFSNELKNENTVSLNLSVTGIQFLQCSRSLVPQLGTIDTQVNTLDSSSLHPDIHKSRSYWMSASHMNFTSQDSTLLESDLWSDMLNGWGLTFTENPSRVDGYLHTSLEQYLETPPSNDAVLKLHDIENALSGLLAMSFWLGGHVQPDSISMRYAISGNYGNRSEVGVAPALLTGNAVTQQETLRVRLNMPRITMHLFAHLIDPNLDVLSQTRSPPWLRPLSIWLRLAPCCWIGSTHVPTHPCNIPSHFKEMPRITTISSSQAPHCVSFNFADQPFNVHSKDKVCGASPLCFFLPSSLALYLTHVITLCPESLHLSIPDVALISPPDRKQNLGGTFDSDLTAAFVQLTAQLETAQHVSFTQIFHALGADPPSWDAVKAGKESEKRHVGVGIVFIRVCSSLRLKAALHPQKADLERPRPIDNAYIMRQRSTIRQVIKRIFFLLASMCQSSCPRRSEAKACLVIFIGVPSALKAPTDGTGLLHNIWLWRNHKNAPNVLKPIEKPTNINLRTAGMVRLQLSLRTERNGDCSSLEKIQSSDSQNDHLCVNNSRQTSPKANEDDPLPTRPAIGYIRIIVLLMHLLLIVGHACLLVLAVARKEHSAVFSINHQQAASFWCTVAAQAVGTTYYSLLVYSTQNAGMSRAIGKYSILTAIHDEVSAWGGIGSASSTAFKQLTLPVSIAGIVSIWLYLVSISILNVTTPALFSVEAFNLPILFPTKTHSTPQWNKSQHDAAVDFMFYNGGEFLKWLGHLDEDKTLGLYNGSLYDVLISAYRGGTAQVAAVGFNITCGYPENHTISHSLLPSVPVFNYIMMIGELPQTDSITLYTPNPVLDSEGSIGPRVAALNTSLQLIQCSKLLVLQNAQVQLDSRAIIGASLNPSIYKSYSKWQSYNSLPRFTNGPTFSGDEYGSEISLNVADGFLAPGDLYLMDQLDIIPTTKATTNLTSSIQPLYLHNIENALSKLVASAFWISGHVPDPSDLYQLATLKEGTATVQQLIPAARLNCSIGLGASILLLFLAIKFSMGSGHTNVSLSSLGFLQNIWVLEHHPELSEILEQVVDPADCNLRSAGLVKVRLLDALSF